MSINFNKPNNIVNDNFEFAKLKSMLGEMNTEHLLATEDDLRIPGISSLRTIYRYINENFNIEKLGFKNDNMDFPLSYMGVLNLLKKNNVKIPNKDKYPNLNTLKYIKPGNNDNDTYYLIIYKWHNPKLFDRKVRWYYIWFTKKHMLSLYESMEFKKPTNIVKDNTMLQGLKNHYIKKDGKYTSNTVPNILDNKGGIEFNPIRYYIASLLKDIHANDLSYIRKKKNVPEEPTPNQLNKNDVIYNINDKEALLNVNNILQNNKFIFYNIIRFNNNDFLKNNYIMVIYGTNDEYGNSFNYEELNDIYLFLIDKDDVKSNENLHESIEFKKPDNIVKDNLSDYESRIDEIDNKYYNPGLGKNNISTIISYIQDLFPENKKFDFYTGGVYGNDLIIKHTANIKNNIINLLKNYYTEIFVIKFDIFEKLYLDKYLCILNVYEDDEETLLYIVSFFVDKDDIEIISNVNESYNFERPKNIVKDNLSLNKLHNIFIKVNGNKLVDDNDIDDNEFISIYDIKHFVGKKLNIPEEEINEVLYEFTDKSTMSSFNIFYDNIKILNKDNINKDILELLNKDTTDFFILSSEHFNNNYLVVLYNSPEETIYAKKENIAMFFINKNNITIDKWPNEHGKYLYLYD